MPLQGAGKDRQLRNTFQQGGRDPLYISVFYKDAMYIFGLQKAENLVKRISQMRQVGDLDHEHEVWMAVLGAAFEQDARPRGESCTQLLRSKHRAIRFLIKFSTCRRDRVVTLVPLAFPSEIRVGTISNVFADEQ